MMGFDMFTDGLLSIRDKYYLPSIKENVSVSIES